MSSFTENRVKTSFTIAPAGSNTSGDSSARKQIGAVWEREAKASKETFFKIRLDMDNPELKVALGSGKDKVDLIAFKNSKKEKGDNRPDFKLYIARD